MKILITGGRGFFGCNLLGQCLKMGFIVDILDSGSYAANDMKTMQGIVKEYHNELVSSVFGIPRIDADNDITFLYTGKIGDVNLLSGMQNRTPQDVLDDYDFVVNFAAESHVDNAILSGYEFIDTNVVQTYSFLKCFIGTKNVRLVHISTDEVFGCQKSHDILVQDDCVCQTDILHGQVDMLDTFKAILPTNIYSSTKAIGEFFINSFVHSGELERVSIIRFCNLFGPYQNSEKFIPHSIRNLLLDKPVSIYGDGLNSREWAYAPDAAMSIVKIMSEFENKSIWNYSSEYSLNNLELSKRIISIVGDRIPLSYTQQEVLFVPDRKGHDRSYNHRNDELMFPNVKYTYEKFNEFLSSTVDYYIAQWHI